MNHRDELLALIAELEKIVIAEGVTPDSNMILGIIFWSMTDRERAAVLHAMHKLIRRRK